MHCQFKNCIFSYKVHVVLSSHIHFKSLFCKKEIVILKIQTIYAFIHCTQAIHAIHAKHYIIVKELFQYVLIIFLAWPGICLRKLDFKRMQRKMNTTGDTCFFSIKAEREFTLVVCCFYMVYGDSYNIMC